MLRMQLQFEALTTLPPAPQPLQVAHVHSVNWPCAQLSLSRGSRLRSGALRSTAKIT